MENNFVMNLTDVIGWFAALAILLAYALVSLQVIAPDELFFQLLNASGAISFVYLAWKRNVVQLGFLNVIWFAIAIISIVKITF